MSSFILGVFAALFLLLAKYGIAKLLLYKKNLLFWGLLVIFSETMVFALPYLVVGVLKRTGEKFIYGFSLGLVTLVLFYVISHVLKKEDDYED